MKHVRGGGGGGSGGMRPKDGCGERSGNGESEDWKQKYRFLKKHFGKMQFSIEPKKRWCQVHCKRLHIDMAV